MNFNCREFKHLISIQRYSLEKNIDGIADKKFNEILQCKAKINNTSGREIQIAEGIASNVTTKFYIRFTRGLNLTTKDRIVFNNKIYNIIYASNIQENNKYYEIVGVLWE